MHRTVRRLAVLVAVALLSPLLVTVAGPASPAGAVVGPQPIPADLWDANPAVGASQSYLLVDGTVGDPVTNGADRLFTQTNSKITLDQMPDRTGVTALEETNWGVGLSTPGDGAPLVVGYYPGASWTTDRDVVNGGVAFRVGTTSCAVSSGWFAVDSVTYVSDTITALTARFSQSCDGAPAMFGKVRWIASDTTTPPYPQTVPSELWDADLGITGDYLYLEGGSPDWLTQGQTRLFTSANADFMIQSYGGNAFTFTAHSDAYWSGTFAPPEFMDELVTGYYPNVDTASRNPTRPQMQWGGDGRGCNRSAGWFSIDELVRQNGVISRLVIRFEHQCDGGVPIHGKLALGAVPLPLPPGDPIGNIDAVYPIPGGVAVAGWALDPETISPITVDMYIDEVRRPFVASDSRPDVEAAYPAYGDKHGFFFAPDLSNAAGSHRFCFYAKNVGAGADTFMGCRVVVVGGPPRGSLDLAVGGPGEVIVGGWAYDPDTGSPIAVHVYAGKVGVATIADHSRPDVGTAHPELGPSRGFDATIEVGPGEHTVCAYGINVGAGANSLLGCRVVTVPTGPPVGSLDAVTLVPGVGVNVGGWALDPDTASPIAVHVYVDGKGTALVAGADRPDIGSFFPGYGPAHGFSATISTGPGLHTVCAYGINTGAGANSSLGCKVVNVPTGSPIGSLDLVAGGKGYVSAGGWAADPDTAAPIAVHLYVDAAGSAVTANLNRPDVGAYFPPWGPLHGWATTVNATPGVHNVCAYAINVGNGSTTLLGCRLVAVT